MAERCPNCGKFMTEAGWGYFCKCGHEIVMVEAPQEPSQDEVVNKEIHDNFWYGNEPSTEAAKEYCNFWHGGN